MRLLLKRTVQQAFANPDGFRVGVSYLDQTAVLSRVELHRGIQRDTLSAPLDFNRNRRSRRKRRELRIELLLKRSVGHVQPAYLQQIIAKLHTSRSARTRHDHLHYT